MNQSNSFSDIDTLYRSMSASVNIHQVRAWSPSVADNNTSKDTDTLLSSTISPDPVEETVIKVPPIPQVLELTRLECCTSLPNLIFQIDYQLEVVNRCSYTFSKDYCRWDASVYREEMSCSIAICIYRVDVESQFLVEGRCLCGDYVLFLSVFQTIQACLENDGSRSTSPSSSVYSSMSPSPLPNTAGFDEDQSETEMETALRAVRQGMLLCPTKEVQCEGLKIMLNASQDVYMHGPVVSTGCLSTLVAIAQLYDHTEIDFNAHLAVSAIANLSASPVCQGYLIASPKFLRIMFCLATDGPTWSSEFRQACARVLCNLSTTAGARKVLEAVEKSLATKWMESVDAMRDSTLRMHATQAKQNFVSCMS